MPFYGQMGQAQGFGYPNYQNAVPDQLTQLRQPYQQGFAQYPPMNNQPQPAQDPSGIIWVQGEAGAKAYMVAAGNTVVLWDSESNTIYLKSADASGIPSMRILDWTERLAQHPAQQNTQQMNSQSQYVTREQFSALVTEFNALSDKFNALTAQKSNNEEVNNAQPAL